MSLKCASLSFHFLSTAFCHPVFDSPLLASYIMSSHHSGPTTYLSSFACSCSAQTRAKRLILALRPSKLSQLSSFSLLSVSISSNTLPGCRYGHQRAGWYCWPLCVKNYSAACLWIIAWRSLRPANTYTYKHTQPDQMLNTGILENYWYISSKSQLYSSGIKQRLDSRKQLDLIRTICCVFLALCRTPLQIVYSNTISRIFNAI